MKYMNPQSAFQTILIAVLCAATYTMPARAQNEPKIVRVDQIIKILNSLEILAKSEEPLQGQNTFNQKVREDVAKTIPKLDADQLGKLALICDSIYWPGDADDVGYDEVYYAAFWECLDRLFKNGDSHSMEALEFVQDHARLDGGERLQFDECMAELQKRSHK